MPHLNTIYPKYYIGSKFNYKEGYLGSVASKKIFNFTDGLSLKDWWKIKTKTEPNNFKLDILEQYNTITPNVLVENELKFQIHFQSIGEDYFNQSYACGKFVSSKKDKEFKQRHSKILKEWYKTKNGIKKRKKISEKNSEIKSKEMKERWLDENFRNYMIKKIKGLKKTNETREKISISKSTKLEYKGVVYVGYKDLELKTGITKHLYKKYYLNGYDPEININNKHPKKVKL